VASGAFQKLLRRRYALGRALGLRALIKGAEAF